MRVDHTYTKLSVKYGVNGSSFRNIFQHDFAPTRVENVKYQLLPKTDLTPSRHVIYQDLPILLRIFELIVFYGDQTQAETEESGSRHKLFSAPYSKYASSQRVLLFDSAVEFPLDRIQPKTHSGSLPAKLLKYEDFEIDFLSSKSKAASTIDNCAFESVEKQCVLCDINYVADAQASRCIKCPQIYVKFLQECLANLHFDSSSDVNLSTLPSLQSLTKKAAPFDSEFLGVTKSRTYSLISYFTSPDMFDLGDYVFSYFYQEPVRNAVVVFQLNLPFVISGVYPAQPEVLYYFTKTYNYFYTLEAQMVDEYSTADNQIVLSLTFNNTVQTDPNSARILSNLLVSSKTHYENGAPKKYFFDSSKARYRYLRLGYSTIERNLHRTIVDGSKLVPLSFNSRFGSVYLHKPYSPFMYELLDKSEAVPDGFYLDQEPVHPAVLACKPECATCDSHDACTACARSHFLLNGACLQCSPECADCELHPNSCVLCSEPSKPLKGTPIGLTSRRARPDRQLRLLARSALQSHTVWALRAVRRRLQL